MSHITSRSPSNAASKAPTHVLSHLALKKMSTCMNITTMTMMSTSIYMSTPMNILMTTNILMSTTIITSILMKNIHTIIMITRANTITIITLT